MYFEDFGGNQFSDQADQLSFVHFVTWSTGQRGRGDLDGSDLLSFFCIEDREHIRRDLIDLLIWFQKLSISPYPK
jgi:hypothetical protein